MYLLDTNVISELRKVGLGKGNPNVAAWTRELDAGDMFISDMTMFELELGVLRAERRNPDEGKKLRTWFALYVQEAFTGRILSVDTMVALRAAALHVPQSQPFRDSFIAATALVHNMIVVTRNVRDFQYPGLAILNPWELQPSRN